MGRRIFTGFTALSCFFLSSQAYPQALSLPHSMAALGDSITAGAFAGFDREDGIYPWKQALFLKQLADYIASGRNPFFIEHKHLSWSTGLGPFRRVKSHAFRLRNLQKKSDLEHGTLRVKNFARTGSQAREVRYNQLEKLYRWSENKLHQPAPDYITLLVGANDLCAEGGHTLTPVGEYLDNVSFILDDLLSRSPSTHILVSALPQIQELRHTLESSPVTRAPWMKTCREVWNITRVCPRVTLSEDPAEQAQLWRDLQDYHWALQDLIATRRAEYGDRIRLADSPFETPLIPEDFSMDCFHPGTEGQNHLAHTTWQASWWASEEDSE